jgi:hypothetical protein
MRMAFSDERSQECKFDIMEISYTTTKRPRVDSRQLG